MADVLAAPAAEPAAGAVSTRVGNLEAGVEPPEAAGLAAAGGAGAERHGANLVLTISVKRPLGRTAMSVGAATWRDQASASVTVAGTGTPCAR